MNNNTAKGWLDGASFYQFFKKGGLNNVIECFIFLGEKLSSFNDKT